MVVSDGAIVRISGTAHPQSLEVCPKTAASAFGGPFPQIPVVKAVIAGIGHFKATGPLVTH